MSDVMLIGGLRAPHHPDDPISQRQLVQLAREAADRIEADAERIAELERELGEQAAERHAGHIGQSTLVAVEKSLNGYGGILAHRDLLVAADALAEAKAIADRRKEEFEERGCDGDHDLAAGCDSVAFELGERADRLRREAEEGES